jgi:protoporphyrinogen oxidase
MRLGDSSGDPDKDMGDSLSRCVVVGAGLPGITASLALAKGGREVVLLDAAPSIGGLLCSYDVGGFSFDYGTHFANKSGIAGLDDLLFGGYNSEWREFPVLRAGNFWNGKLNESSDNPDLNTLGAEKHDRCLSELLLASGWQGDSSADNAKEFLIAEYGPYLVETFFDPVFRKFTGLSSESLHHQANLLFNLKRFAVLDPDATTELKRSVRYDAKVSYHHREHFNGHKPCFYPIEGGIGRWIEQLEEKIHQYGIKLITNANIESVSIADGRIDKLVFDRKEIIVDELFWGVAPAIFCKLAGIRIEGSKPAARSTVLVGVEIDKPFETDCHYFTVFDDNFKSFRVTLYDNFRSAHPGRHAATVEFMVEPREVQSIDWQVLAESELRGMGVLGTGTTVLARHQKIVANGFPVQTNATIAGLASQSLVVKGFTNVHLVGRGSGEGWFLDGLVRNAYKTSLELLDREETQ